MKKKLWIALTLATGAGVFSANAQNGPSPEQLAANATETRQSVLRVISFNMGTISGMARGQVEFDAEIAERNARRIAMLAPIIPEAFAARDTREFDVETEALPIIWDRFSEFEERAANLERAALAFAEVASGGDRMATIGAVREFGAACGNCHDTFRVDDD